MTQRQIAKENIRKFLVEEGFEPNEFGQVVCETKDGTLLNINLIILNFFDYDREVNLTNT